MKLPFLLKLVLSIAVCLAAGFLGSLFTRPNIPAWYSTLSKPPFAPPNWLFGPVWTLLYILMGIALALVWRQHGIAHGTNAAILVFTVHLFFNALWSVAFFGLRSPLLGLVDIAVLLVMIIATIRVFFPISRSAAFLLIPYALWVCFATVLNTSLYVLNRGP